MVHPRQHHSPPDLSSVRELRTIGRRSRGADPGGLHPSVAQARLLPGPECVLLVALPPHRERGPDRAPITPETGAAAAKTSAASQARRWDRKPPFEKPVV